MEGVQTFNDFNLKSICDILAEKDQLFKSVINTHGYPPFWNRKANFETLVHIILEQQVSLSSVRAALNKLKEKLGAITPQKILLLTDAELRACYLSRQKILYVKDLAQAIISKKLNLTQLSNLSDDIAKEELMKIKGIGEWTATVYLMMALQRVDLFPAGDIGIIVSIKEEKGLHENPSKGDIKELAESWKPYRTLAAYILWHSYLSKRKRQNY